MTPEQNSGKYNPMYQLVYDQQVKSHPTKPPDLYTHPQKSNKPVGPQLATNPQLKVHETLTKNC
jgi:hypothetical protein